MLNHWPIERSHFPFECSSCRCTHYPEQTYHPNDDNFTEFGSYTSSKMVGIGVLNNFGWRCSYSQTVLWWMMTTSATSPKRKKKEKKKPPWKHRNLKRALIFSSKRIEDNLCNVYPSQLCFQVYFHNFFPGTHFSTNTFFPITLVTYPTYLTLL